MTDQQRLFHDLFCSGHFPEISDEVINCIEDFLVFNASADSSDQLNCLFEFYSTKFCQFQQDLNGLTDNSRHLLYRLLHTLRFLRPSHFNEEISTKLESIVFTYLKMPEKDSNDAIINQEALIILIDHFIAHPHGKDNKINELIDFILNFLNLCSNPISNENNSDETNSPNLTTIDHKFLFIIIYSFRFLLTVCDKSIVQSVLPKTINLLIKISLNALLIRNESYFFPDFELIVSKSLRLAAYLTEGLKNFSKETLDMLVEIQKNIPDDVRYMHINFNFMLFACTIFELNDASSPPPKPPPAPNSSPSPANSTSKQAILTNIKTYINTLLQDTPIQKVFDDITQIIPFFIFPPFNKSRRTTLFFHTFKDWVTRKIQLTSFSYTFVFPKIFPMFGHLQGHPLFLKDSYETFKYFLKPEFLLNKPGLQLDLLEQFVTCLDMIRDEFDSYDFTNLENSRPFEVEYYLDANITIFRLIELLLYVKDTGEISKYARAELFVRIFNYIDYFLDIAGQYGSPKCEGEPLINYFHQQIAPSRFKDKITEFITALLSMFSRLPLYLSNYLIPTNLYSLIPKKAHHSYHTTLIHWVTRVLPKQSVFFFSFFTCIVNHFDELFLPKPNNCTLITIQQIFNECFIKSNDSHLSVQICILFYNFMNLAIASREKSMIEFVFTLFKLIKTPPPKVEPTNSQQQQKVQIQTIVNLKQQQQQQQQQQQKSVSDSTKQNKHHNSTGNNNNNNSNNVNKTINLNTASLIPNGIPIRSKTPTPITPGLNKETLTKQSFQNQQNQPQNSATIKLNPTSASGIAQNISLLMLNNASSAQSQQQQQQTNPIYQRPTKLEPFFSLLKKTMFPYHQILRTLEDDPKLELCTSVLSIYMYPLLTIPIDYVDSWITLFLPAIESDTYRPKIIQPILEIFSDNLPNWIVRIKENTQYRLLRAFSKEKIFVNLLLSKIPNVSSLHSMMASQSSSNNNYENDPDSVIVTYEEEEEDENETEEIKNIEENYYDKIMKFHEKKEKNLLRKQKIPYDTLFSGFDTLTKPTQEQLEALIKCFICFINKLNFPDSVTCRLVNQTYEFYVKHNKTEIINDAYKITKKIPAKYSLIFLREHLGKLCVEEIVTNNEIIPDPSDFMNYITLLCYRSYTCSTAVKIIGYLLPLVPNNIVFVRATSSLLHGSIFEPKLVKMIYNNHIFTRQFNLETDMKSLQILKNVFFNAGHISLNNFHILAMKGLDFVLKVLNASTTWIDERVKKIINDLPNIQLDGSCMKYKFIFTRPFIEPVDSNLLTKIIEKFVKTDFPNISPETQKLLKMSALSDKFLIPFETEKLLLKVICRLLTTAKQAEHIWDRLFFILSEEKFKPILPYFYKRIKKEAGNGGFPSIISVPHFIKLYAKQMQVSPSTTPQNANVSSSSSSNINTNYNQNTASNPNLKSLTTPQINVNLQHSLAAAAVANVTSPHPSPSLNQVSQMLYQNSQIGLNTNQANTENNSSQPPPQNTISPSPSPSTAATTSTSSASTTTPTPTITTQPSTPSTTSTPTTNTSNNASNNASSSSKQNISANQASTLAGLVAASGSANFNSALAAVFHNQQAKVQAQAQAISSAIQQNLMLNQQQQQQQTPNIPSPDDIKFLYIIIRYSTKMQTQQFQGYINWLISALNSYQNSFQNAQKDTIQRGITEILRVIRRIKKIDQRVDVSSVYKSLFEIFIFLRQYLLPINLPIYKMALADPNMTVRVMLNMIKEKKWNSDLFLIGCNLFSHKKCTTFRNGMTLLIFENLKFISRYLNDNASTELDFIINKTSCSIAECFTKLDVNDFNISAMLKLSKGLFFEIMKTRNDFKPIYLYNFTQIFFPIRFASIIESSSDLFYFYKTQILIIFMATPKLFFHPLFIRKFIQFMKTLSIQSRLDIWMNSLPKLKSDDKFSLILNNLLKNELYKSFPGVEKEENKDENKDENQQPRREITIGFAEYNNYDAFFAYMLNYTGAMLAYSNPNILITDLADNSIADICSHVHALFIRENLRDETSIRTVQRFSTVSRSIQQLEGKEEKHDDKNDDDDDEENKRFIIDFNKTLINMLSIHPFMSKQTSICFKMFTQQNLIVKKPSKELMQYLLSFSSIMIENTHKTPDRQLFTYIPVVFKNLQNNKTKIGCDRILDILIYTIVLVMDKMNYYVLSAQPIPSTIELFIPLVNVNNVNTNLLDKLKEKLLDTSNQLNNPIENKTEPNTTNTNQQQQSTATNQTNIIKQNQLKVKFILQLIQTMAPLLFSSEFLPPDILPSNFFSHPFVKELMLAYQSAVQKSIQEGGTKVAQWIIDDTYKMFKNYPLSKPLKTPFATAAEWIKEFKGGELNLYYITNILIDVTKPRTIENLIIELHHIKQPVHPVILNSISNLVKDQFPDFSSSYKRIPKLFILSTEYISKKSNDDDLFELMNQSFKINWYLIDQSTHLPLFARLVFPDVFHGVLRHLNEKELQRIVVTSINNQPPEFGKFVQYYIHCFPNSSLAVAFTLHSSSSHSVPLPYNSLYKNMSILEQSNDWNDSLGLLQQTFPRLLSATSFHELGNYASARNTYLASMIPKNFMEDMAFFKDSFYCNLEDLYDDTIEDDVNQFKHSNRPEDFYFYALLKLRNCFINESLSSLSNLRDNVLKTRNSMPIVQLPLFQDSTPFLKFEHPQTEIMNPNRLMTTFITPSFIPMFFKSSLYEEIHIYLKVYMDQKINFDEFVRMSSLIWINSLDRLTAMSSNFSWRFSILEDFIQNSSSFEKNPFIATSAMKIQEIIKSNHETNARLLAQADCIRYALKQVEKAECYYSKDIIKLTSRNISRINHFLKKNPKFASINCDTLIMLRNFKDAWPSNAQRHISRRQILRIYLSMILYFPTLIQKQFTLNYLFAELGNAESIDKYLVLSLICSLMRKDEELKSLWTQLKSDQYDLILEWLPLLFKTCGNLPINFMISLMEYNYPYFLLQLHQLNNSRLMSDKSYFADLNNSMRKLKEYILEFESSIEFTKAAEDDISSMFTAIKAIRLFYIGLIKGRSNIEFPEDLRNYFTNFEELTEFVANHPPVFQTKIKMTDYISLRGFKFPKTSQNVLRIQIESGDQNEAHIKYTTIKGETKSFLLLPLHIYKLTHNEYLLTNILNKMIMYRNECSSLIYYPQAFLIHPMLLLVNAPESSNMGFICKPYSIPKLLYCFKDASKDSSDHLTSPKEVIDRRIPGFIPKDLLFNWFVKGSKGTKNDFLFLRRSFAIHFGSISYLHSLFGSPQVVYPPLLFLNDRQKVCFSGFMDRTILYASIALTPQIETLLPEFVLRGSFAASWHTVADTALRHMETLRVILSAILADSQDTSMVSKVIDRMKKFGNQIGEDTDKADEYFPFMYLDHLIKTSNNVMLAQPTKFGWV